MKKQLLPALLLALGLVGQLRADLYDLTFAENAGGPTTAAGQIDVVSGFALSGFLDVTGGPGMGHYAFVVASGVAAGVTGVGTTLYKSPDDYFLSDGAVFVGANPFLTEGGLVFSAGGKEFNLFYSDVDSSYFLVGSNGHSATGKRLFDPVAGGIATLTAVPESSATLAMFGTALLGVAALRRRWVG